MGRFSRKVGSVRVRALLDWYGAQARDLPWRRTADPYGVWVSEIMLQQTQVKTVIPYWERWMRELPDIAALASASEARLLKLWEGLGYYRRVRHMHAAARRIEDGHAGCFPKEWEQVLALPGIGRYTAGAICSIAFDQPRPVLDGNVMRVLTRWARHPGDPRSADLNARLWDEARGLVGIAADTGRPKACSHLNQALMELGATVCLPRQPECADCPVAPGCRARQQGDPESYPQSAPRPATTVRQFITIVARYDGRYAVRQRPRDEVNGGFWEFPHEEFVLPRPGPAEVASRLIGLGAVGDGSPVPWGEVRHAITRYRLRQHVFRVEYTRRPRPRAGLVWQTVEELQGLALTSAHRRLVRRLHAEPARHLSDQRRTSGLRNA